MTYRVENPEGCTVVYGSVPLTVMASILKSAGKDAVMSNELQNILGATIVAGSPVNLEKLKASCEKPKIPDQLRDMLGEGACKWVESGRIGSSSNFMLFTFTGFNALTWLKHGAAFNPAEVAYPHDPDDLSRCRHLLEAEPRFKARLPELSKTSPTWESLVAQWNQICDAMDVECPEWLNGLGSAPKTYALMQAVIAGKKESFV
jgi:hypothetical protein